jgi:hypothetical protein
MAALSGVIGFPARVSGAVVRSDVQSGNAYVGVALSGARSSDAVWRITRVGVVPPVTSASASNVAWDNRLTATYT